MFGGSLLNPGSWGLAPLRSGLLTQWDTMVLGFSRQVGTVVWIRLEHIPQGHMCQRHVPWCGSLRGGKLFKRWSLEWKVR